MDTQTTGSLRRQHKTIYITIIILLTLVIGTVSWLAWSQYKDNQRLSTDKTTLENQLKELRAKLASAEASSGTSDTGCTATVSDAIKSAISGALDARNLAALSPYMASRVRVVFAASEFDRTRTPAEAITDMNYIASAGTPWNFALPATTLAAYRAGFYASYFGTGTYTGQSTDNYVVSFGFDTCAKINTVFMTNHADLLR